MAAIPTTLKELHEALVDEYAQIISFNRASQTANVFINSLKEGRPWKFIHAAIWERLSKWGVHPGHQFLQAIVKGQHRNAKLLTVHPLQWLSGSLVRLPPTIPKGGKATQNAIKITVQASALLQLPPEIRAMIFKYALDDSELESPYDGHDLPGILAPQFTSPPLVRTCRQIRYEVLPQFYFAKTFVLYVDSFSSFAAARDWLKHVGDFNLALIQNLVLIGYKTPGGTCRLDESTTGMYVKQVRLGVDLHNIEVNAFVPDQAPEFALFGTHMSLIVRKMKQTASGAVITSAMLESLLKSFAKNCVDMEEMSRSIRVDRGR